MPDNLGEIVILLIGRRKHCPNAEIVSRLNSLILADRGLKCVPYKEIGCEKLKSAVGIGTGSSFGRHFDEKPKIGVFLCPVFLSMGHARWILGAVI